MAENLWERLFGRADRGYGVKTGQGLNEAHEALGITPGVSQQVGTQGRTHTTDDPDYYNPDAPVGTPQDIYNIQRDQQFPTQQRQEEKGKGFNLFEWIKSILTNPNISSTQASQMLNDAGVMAKDLMMAMNPMGTAQASQVQMPAPEPTPPFPDPNAPVGEAYMDPTPIVLPQNTGSSIADPGGMVATGPHSDRVRTTTIDPGFLPPVREPTTAMYGSNVRASQMTPGLEQERIRGEFYNMPSTPPVPRAGMGFEDVKRGAQRRGSTPAPTQPSYTRGLIPPVSRTPYKGPGKRGFSRATTQPRRFGPH